MSYSPSPITQRLPHPLHTSQIWQISGRFGCSFMYLNVNVLASAPTAMGAMEEVVAWLVRKHPYLPHDAQWVEGPFFQRGRKRGS